MSHGRCGEHGAPLEACHITPGAQPHEQREGPRSSALHQAQPAHPTEAGDGGLTGSTPHLPHPLPGLRPAPPPRPAPAAPPRSS